MNKKEIALRLFILILVILTGVCIIAFAFIIIKPDVGKQYDIHDMDTIYHFDYSLLEGNQILSYEDENYTSQFGIDVSEFSEDIDWQKVKKAGTEFVYLRLGYRGKDLGGLYLDERFEEYYEGANEVGLQIGVYFFSQAINEQEAIEEAQYVISNIKGKNITLPIAYDLEVPESESRITVTNPYEKTRNAISFVDEIKRHNYDAIIYTNNYFSRYYYSMEDLKDYEFWYAQYGSDKPSFDYKIKIWQYSQSYKLDGIDGNVDYDIMFKQKNDQY